MKEQNKQSGLLSNEKNTGLGSITKKIQFYYAAVIVSLLTFVVYLPTLRNQFVSWDDDGYVVENFHIQSLDWSFLKWAFTNLSAGGLHPLIWISYAIDYAIWGLNPMGYHLTAIIIHAVNTFLVVYMIMKILNSVPKLSDPAAIPFLDGRGKLITCGVTGLLFGLHPLHVESVAWIAERKDLLCAFFFLLSIIAYTNFVVFSALKSKEKNENSIVSFIMAGKWYLNRWYLLSLILFIFALASKAMAVSLPIVLLILDWYPYSRIRTAKKNIFRVFAEKIPFIALSLIATIAGMSGQKAIGALSMGESIPFSVRILVAFRSLMLYLWKMIVPSNLIPFYVYPQNVSFLSAEYFLAVSSAVGISAACVFIYRRQRIFLAVWTYYVVTLLPVLGIIQFGQHSMADRFTYLPSLGPFLIVGIAAAWIFGKANALQKRTKLLKIAAILLSGIILVLMIFLTVKQIGFWKNDLVFWNYVIEKQPGKAIQAYNNRGLYFGKTGNLDKAIEDFSMAAKIDPKAPESYNNLGFTYYLKGEYPKAVAEFNRAILLDNYYVKAYMNRAGLYLKMGKDELALKDYQKICNSGYSDYCGLARALQSTILNRNR